MKLFEQYYCEKLDTYEPNGLRPTKREIRALEDKIEATLNLPINKKDAAEKGGPKDLEFETEICKHAVDA
jgi:hypothetical protein